MAYWFLCTHPPSNLRLLHSSRTLPDYLLSPRESCTVNLNAPRHLLGGVKCPFYPTNSRFFTPQFANCPDICAPRLRGRHDLFLPSKGEQKLKKEREAYRSERREDDERDTMAIGEKSIRGWAVSCLPSALME